MNTILFLQKSWRPLSGVFCALGLLYISIVQRLLMWGSTEAVHKGPPEVSGAAIGVLTAYLMWLTGGRTVEKIKTKNTQDANGGAA